MGKPVAFKKINGQERTVTPFKVYKSWRYTDTGSLQNDGLDVLYAIKPNPAVYSGNKVTLDTVQTNLDSGSFLINSANNKEASVIWYSLNHLYYKRAGIPAETFGYADPYAIERTLFNEATVYSIPQRKFGEIIKPGSVKLNFRNTGINATSMSLIDDGKGNLIDSELSSSISNQVLHLGFDAMTYCPNYAPNFDLSTSQQIGSLIDFQLDSINPNLTAKGNAIINNSTFSNNYYTSTIASIFPWGNDAFFGSASYIRIPNDDSFNFKQTDDFALSFWVSEFLAPTLQIQQIISKRTTGIGQYMIDNKVYTGDINYNASQYPFDIYFFKGPGGSPNQLICRNSNGSVITTLSSSVSINTENHVVLQKTGSEFQLYVGGALVQQHTLPSDGNFYNNADLFIGSLGLNSSGNGYNSFKGTFDEFFIFNKGLTQSEITQLADSSSYAMTTNTNVVGNVFYEHGLIVVSDPRPKYCSTGSINTFSNSIYFLKGGITFTPTSNYLDDTNFKLEYNSTVTLYEHEYICKLKEDEFNFTTNPTIRLNNDVNSEIPKAIVSNNSFAPYITTVGLYNDAGELLAIGKLGTPIQKRDNVDTTIIVRFDI
jgi:hypothetical protein